MKFLILVLTLIFGGVFRPLNIDSCSATTQTTTYAKAGANCVLYKTQNLTNTISNVYFIVPETYFVIVLDEISETCLKVQYDKFVGYVEASKVTIATFIPIVKTLKNVTVDIKNTSGTQIWSYPDTSSNILTTISAGTVNLNYIASCYGTIPNGGDANLWFYVSFTPSQNSTNVYEGYIYSENTTNLSQIVANAEFNPEIIDEAISNENILYLSSSFKTIVIAIITIPIIIFLLIILYNLGKKYKEFTNKQKLKKSENIDSYNNPDLETTTHTFNKNSPINQADSPTIHNPLKENLSKLKNLKLIKKKDSNNFQNLKNYPSFPDYNPDDDIL